MAPKLILTGFMATGKTAVGLIVARRLGWIFVDTDAAIAARAGKPIAEIFARDGEAEFRRMERETVAIAAGGREHCPQCGERRPAVISTGGGALIDDQNCSMLKRAGLVICLSARAEVIAARIGKSVASRPKLLEGGMPLEDRISHLMRERAPAYERADLTLDTSDLTPDEVAARVIDAFVALGRPRWKPST